MKFLFFSCLFVFLETVGAQVIPLSFHQLNAENGLASGQYNNIIYDDAGVFWISSLGGLNIYDGHHIRTVKPNGSDSTGLYSPVAPGSEIVHGKNGNLWFCNGEGIIEYDRLQDSFLRHQPRLTAKGDSIRKGFDWHYLDQATGAYWFSTSSGIYRCPDFDFSQVVRLTDRRVGGEKKIFPSPDGGHYLFRLRDSKSEMELFTFSAKQVGAQKSTPIYTSDDSYLEDILFVSDTLIWVATNKGLKRYDLQHKKWFNHSMEYNGQLVEKLKYIAATETGELLLATANQGIYVYDIAQERCKGKIHQYDHGDLSVFAPTITGIRVDDAQNLWVSTSQKGLYFASLVKTKFDQLYVDNEQGHQDFKGFAQSPDQATVWALTSTEAIAMRENDTSYYALPLNGVEIEIPMFIFEDSKGRVWVGTLEWLLVKYPDSTEFKPIKKILPSKTSTPPGYTGMIELPGGDLVIGTNEASAFRINTDLEESEWLDEFKPGSFAFLRRGNSLLAATKTKTIEVFSLSADHTLVLDTIIELQQLPLAIKYDKFLDCYWVPTLGDGLQKISELPNGKFRIDKEVDLEKDNIFSVEIGADTALWLGTPQGLTRYDPLRFSKNSYTFSDGLQGMEFAYFASLAAADGRLFFGGANGVNTFLPAQVKSRIADPRPMIVDIVIEDDSLGLAAYNSAGVQNPMQISALELPYEKRTLNLRFAAREYSDPSLCRFRTRLLVGEDTSRPFSVPTQNHERTLGPLSPGQYTFELQAANADGKWSETTHRLSILVHRHWAQTRLAYLIYALLLVGVCYLIYRRRLKAMTKREKLKTEAAVSRQLAAERETSVLRLQMNPHFIFNGLIAVSYFIRTDQKKSQSFLKKFSDLMRKTLNRSEKPLTRLDDSIEFLEEYLSAEKMRIGDNMSFSIDEDPELDTFSTYAPTMIVQPFVENAVWHGITGLPRPGHIKLRYSRRNDQLLIEVIDNGWGRAAKRQSAKTHASKSSSIATRRFSLLNASLPENSPKAYYKTFDLEDADGQPAGTRVAIYLPLTYQTTTV